MTDTTYATIDQLQAGPMNNDPALTPERAQELLNQVAVIVDAALVAAGYVVPATDDQDIALINPYLVNMAAVMAHRELYQDDEDPARIAAWEAQFNGFLAAIAKGTIRLPGQATSDNTGGLRVGRIRFNRRAGLTSEWS